MSAKQPESLRTQFVRFIRQQDGDSEQLFAERVIPVLSSFAGVTAAYLALVTYSRWFKNRARVALCVRADGVDLGPCFAAVGDVFTGLFRAQASLDMLQINAEQESKLGAVCRPFFMAPIASPLPDGHPRV